MSLRSMPREPCSPQIFFGRDPELSQIIDMIFTNLGSHPARIAILGPGGYGKTTLANAVLTHRRVQRHFGDARYFVSCESIFSSGALLAKLAKTLGLLDSATDISWSRICIASDMKDCILCLDNFESPWGQDADIRNSVEELLSRVTELQHVSLLITVRGTVRPAQTRWTMPLLPPLITLDHDAARSIWEQTANNYDAFAEELTKAVDYVPLAISLLAHLAQATSPELLLNLWHSKKTGFIYTGQANKLSNLEYSIKLSIDSSRMRANPSA
jgi:Cdc6-like AAA superfamily ATPase